MERESISNQKAQLIVHRGVVGVGGYMIHIQNDIKWQEAGLPDSRALLIGVF